jgi:hypothetical protein
LSNFIISVQILSDVTWKNEWNLRKSEGM